jgi:addiction module HigA family antidote
MDALNLSAAELARAIGVPANRVSQIVAGLRNVSADTALRLGKLFSTGPRFWLNLQMAYELDLAKASGAPNLASIVPLIQPTDHSGAKRPCARVAGGRAPKGVS